MIISLNSLHGDYQRFKSEGLTVETRGDTIIETDREDFPYELKHHCSVTNLKRVEVKFDYNAFIIIDDKILIYCDDENFDEITEKLRSVGAHNDFKLCHAFPPCFLSPLLGHCTSYSGESF